MKTRLLSVSAFAAMLTLGCAKNETASSSAADVDTSSSSLTAAAVVPAAETSDSPAAAQPSGAARVVEITANDQMKFSISSIEAKAGEELKVVLTNVGTLPKEAMGHNWVLLKPGTDVAAFATAAMTAKDHDYVPASMKDKVVASIKVLGPKQKGEVTFKVPAAGEYPFICSFPGHYMLMKGTLTAK